MCGSRRSSAHRSYGVDAGGRLPGLLLLAALLTALVADHDRYQVGRGGQRVGLASQVADRVLDGEAGWVLGRQGEDEGAESG